jgi:hypothetical protein
MTQNPDGTALPEPAAASNLKDRFLVAVKDFDINEAPANLNKLLDHSSPDGLTHSTPAAFAAMDSPYVPAGSPCPDSNEMAAVFNALNPPAEA